VHLQPVLVINPAVFEGTAAQLDSVHPIFRIDFPFGKRLNNGLISRQPIAVDLLFTQFPAERHIRGGGEQAG
jgi:hypothetical protein